MLEDIQEALLYLPTPNHLNFLNTLGQRKMKLYLLKYKK